MNNKNTHEESNMDMGKAELRDLIHYWDNLSHWERDQSIATVDDFLSKVSESDDVSNKQIQKMREQVKALSESNVIEKQSKINMKLEQCLELRKSIRKKPNYNKSMDIIQSLSKEELLELGEYLGMTKARLSFMKPAELYQLYDEILTSKTITVFFAMRNFLGKRHT
jgi:hypothetical protein